jgi:hypothetical protein
MGSQTHRYAERPIMADFTAGEILPKIVDVEPKRWLPALKAAASDLPHPEREELLREARKVLKARKGLYVSIMDAVAYAQTHDEAGNRAEQGLLGVLLYGSITGRSHGDIVPRKALDPARWCQDIDYIIVYDGEKHKYLPPAIERAVFLSLGRHTNMACQYGGAIRLTSDGEAARAKIAEIRSHLKGFDPKPWHFMGDPSAKERLAKILEAKG